MAFVNVLQLDKSKIFPILYASHQHLTALTILFLQHSLPMVSTPIPTLTTVLLVYMLQHCHSFPVLCFGSFSLVHSLSIGMPPFSSLILLTDSIHSHGCKYLYMLDDSQTYFQVKLLSSKLVFTSLFDSSLDCSTNI